MMSRLIKVAGLAATLGACAHGAGMTESGHEVTVRSNVRSHLSDHASVSIRGNGHCFTASLPVVAVATHPQHGRVVIERGMGAVNAPASECAERRLPSIVVRYQSAAGFRGADRLSYVVRYADGKVMALTYNISVR